MVLDVSFEGLWYKLEYWVIRRCELLSNYIDSLLGNEDLEDASRYYAAEPRQPYRIITYFEILLAIQFGVLEYQLGDPLRKYLVLVCATLCGVERVDPLV